MSKTSVKPVEKVAEPIPEKVETPIPEVKVTYSKAKILSFQRYQNRVDLLGALLLDEAEYTLEEVDEMINNFMKG